MAGATRRGDEKHEKDERDEKMAARSQVFEIMRAPGWSSRALAGASFLVLSSILTIAGWVLAHQSGGAVKLDFIWPFEAAVYGATLDQYGEAGRATFFWILWIDMIFPLTVVWFAWTLFRPSTRLGRRLVYAPVAFLILDLVENILFLRMLSSGAALSEGVAILTSAVTIAKLLALAITYVGMLVAIAAWAWRDRKGFAETGLGLVATGGFVLCAYLAPVQSTIWNAPDLPVLVAWAPWVDSALASSSGPLSPYYAFGRMTILVYLGIGAGLLRAGRRTLGKGSRLSQEPLFRVLAGVLAIAALGNGIEYWGGSLYGESVKSLGFRIVETPALGITALVAMGLGLKLVRRPGSEARALAWPFLGVLPAILLSTLSLQYLPHGPLFAWAAASAWLALAGDEPGRERVSAPERTSPSSGRLPTPA